MKDFIDFHKLVEQGKVEWVRLSPDHQIKDFDCGVDDLNDFLKNDSKIYLRNLSYTTYLLESEDFTIAYYSLANDLLQVRRDYEDFKIELQHPSFDSQYEDIFFAQDSYPAVKIGRLAVNKKLQNQGIGNMIVSSLTKSFISNNKTGCQFITVDAINCPKVLRFYENNGFSYLKLTDVNQESRIMYKFLLKYIDEF